MKKILVLVITLFLPLSLFVNYRVFADTYVVPVDMGSDTTTLTVGYRGDADLTITTYDRYSNTDNVRYSYSFANMEQGGTYTIKSYYVSTGGFIASASDGSSHNNSSYFIEDDQIKYLSTTITNATAYNPSYVQLFSSTYGMNYGYMYGICYPNPDNYDLEYIGSAGTFDSWVGNSDPYEITVNSPCYMIARGQSNTGMTVVFFYDSPFTVVARRGNTTISPTVNEFYLEDTKYYYYEITNWTYSPNSYDYAWDRVYTDMGSQNFIGYIVAVENNRVVPDNVNYGSLQTGFTTYFTASSQTSYITDRLNKDVITWGRYDTNNNNIYSDINAKVQIRFLPCFYSAQDENTLKQQTLNSLTDIAFNMTPVTVEAVMGKYEITWGEVADYFTQNGLSNWDFGNLRIYHDANSQVFMKLGWYYQARLIVGQDLDNPRYVGPWQTLYNGTSIPPEPSDDILNNYNTLTPELINALQELNTVNNTTNNYYTGDTIIYTGSDGEGEGFLTALIKAIQQLLSDIIKFIGDLFGSILDGLVDLILGLFDNIDIVGTFADWFTRLKEFFDNLDLTLPQFEVPDPEVLEGFGELIPATLSIFSGSGLGFVIWVPLILIFLRIVL